MFNSSNTGGVTDGLMYCGAAICWTTITYTVVTFVVFQNKPAHVCSTFINTRAVHICNDSLYFFPTAVDGDRYSWTIRSGELCNCCLPNTYKGPVIVSRFVRAVVPRF